MEDSDPSTGWRELSNRTVIHSDGAGKPHGGGSIKPGVPRLQFFQTQVEGLEEDGTFWEETAI